MKATIEPGDLVEFNWRENAALGTRVTGIVINEREAEVCNHPRAACRLLVKRARLAEQWPTDIGGNLTDEQRREGRAFRVFAAKVADAVQSFVGIGGQLKPGDCECICPLGCLPGAYGPRPGSVTGYNADACAAFYEGFDALPPEHRATTDDSNPYLRLGAAYRARFLPKTKEAA
jgi:hypothetical protein